MVIGIQAPQGAGKTTLVRHLIARMADLGLHAAGVSIDDFYLPRADQLRLAASYPGNPYLEHRGYPGTHDLALGAATLDALRALGPGSRATVRVPVYDKTAHSGRGDRAPDAAWRDVTGPLDVVFVEGWMLGFAPVAESNLPEPDLIAPNRALAGYAQWDRRLDAFVTLRPIDPLFVMRWRVEAEAETAAQGRPALDRAAIEDYVRRFLPAYHLHCPRSRTGPRRALSRLSRRRAPGLAHAGRPRPAARRLTRIAWGAPSVEGVSQAFDARANGPIGKVAVAEDETAQPRRPHGVGRHGRCADPDVGRAARDQPIRHARGEPAEHVHAHGRAGDREGRSEQAVDVPLEHEPGVLVATAHTAEVTGEMAFGDEVGQDHLGEGRSAMPEHGDGAPEGVGQILGDDYVAEAERREEYPC